MLENFKCCVHELTGLKRLKGARNFILIKQKTFVLASVDVQTFSEVSKKDALWINELRNKMSIRNLLCWFYLAQALAVSGHFNKSESGF